MKVDLKTVILICVLVLVVYLVYTHFSLDSSSQIKRIRDKLKEITSTESDSQQIPGKCINIFEDTYSKCTKPDFPGTKGCRVCIANNQMNVRNNNCTGDMIINWCNDNFDPTVFDPIEGNWIGSPKSQFYRSSGRIKINIKNVDTNKYKMIRTDRLDNASTNLNQGGKPFDSADITQSNNMYYFTFYYRNEDGTLDKVDNPIVGKIINDELVLCGVLYDNKIATCTVTASFAKREKPTHEYECENSCPFTYEPDENNNIYDSCN